MKRLILIATVFLSLPAVGQKIEVSKTLLKVNSIPVSKESEDTTIIKAFGEPENFDADRFTFSYTSKGVVVTGDRIVKKLRGISLYMTADEPARSFAGTLLMGGITIKPTTTIDAVKKIPGIKIDYAGEAGVDAVYGNFRINMFYSTSTKSLQTVSIKLTKED